MKPEITRARRDTVRMITTDPRIASPIAIALMRKVFHLGKDNQMKETMFDSIRSRIRVS